MGICLSQISGYKQLITEVDSLRKIPYSSENEEHERNLLQVGEGYQLNYRL